MLTALSLPSLIRDALVVSVTTPVASAMRSHLMRLGHGDAVHAVQRVACLSEGERAWLRSATRKEACPNHGSSHCGVTADFGIHDGQKPQKLKAAHDNAVVSTVFPKTFGPCPRGGGFMALFLLIISHFLCARPSPSRSPSRSSEALHDGPTALRCASDPSAHPRSRDLARRASSPRRPVGRRWPCAPFCCGVCLLRARGHLLGRPPTRTRSGLLSAAHCRADTPLPAPVQHPA